MKDSESQRQHLSSSEKTDPKRQERKSDYIQVCNKGGRQSEHHLNAGQEAPVRTGHVTTDWFQIGKGVRQGCILSPCLFNFYAEYIMRNAGLEETQAGIKIADKNINNLRCADDTTLMAESEEKLKSFLMRVKEASERASLKLNIKKKKKLRP